METSLWFIGLCLLIMAYKCTLANGKSPLRVHDDMYINRPIALQFIASIVYHLPTALQAKLLFSNLLTTSFKQFPSLSVLERMARSRYGVRGRRSSKPQTVAKKTGKIVKAAIVYTGCFQLHLMHRWNQWIIIVEGKAEGRGYSKSDQ